MADFKTHITTSTTLGFVYGGVGYFAFGVPLAHSFIAGGLCSVAGMLPDLDSNSGIPQREMLSFVSVVVPMLMLPRFEAIGIHPEHMVFISGLMYVLIRFGIGGIFKKYTKHRGMWHSIPAALIAGLATFLVCLTSDFETRIVKSWAIVLGFISHLLLDEIYAVNWQGKLPKVKKSFGTALKFWGKNKFANIFTYVKLAALVALIASDNYVMECICEPPIDSPQSANNWVRNLFLNAHDHTFHR